MRTLRSVIFKGRKSSSACEDGINPSVRPCVVSSHRNSKRKALFHKWFEQYAIVEYEDGTVEAVDYPYITFSPADFDEHSWGWCE